jgi:hypothetical protein
VLHCPKGRKPDLRDKAEPWSGKQSDRRTAPWTRDSTSTCLHVIKIMHKSARTTPATHTLHGELSVQVVPSPSNSSPSGTSAQPTAASPGPQRCRFALPHYRQTALVRIQDVSIQRDKCISVAHHCTLEAFSVLARGAVPKLEHIVGTAILNGVVDAARLLLRQTTVR